MAIQVVYYHYMLTQLMWNVCGMVNVTPLFEARLADTMNEQRAYCGNKDKHSLVQQIYVLTAITFIFEKKQDSYA